MCVCVCWERGGGEKGARVVRLSSPPHEAGQAFQADEQGLKEFGTRMWEREVYSKSQLALGK